jgi:hypothetical protein
MRRNRLLACPLWPKSCRSAESRAAPVGSGARVSAQKCSGVLEGFVPVPSQLYPTLAGRQWELSGLLTRHTSPRSRSEQCPAQRSSTTCLSPRGLCLAGAHTLPDRGLAHSHWSPPLGIIHAPVLGICCTRARAFKDWTKSATLRFRRKRGDSREM